MADSATYDRLSNSQLINGFRELLQIARENLASSSPEERNLFLALVRKVEAEVFSEEQFWPKLSIATNYIGGVNVACVLAVSRHGAELEFVNSTHAPIYLCEPFLFFLRVREADASRGKGPEWATDDYKIEISPRANFFRFIIRAKTGELAYMMEVPRGELKVKMRGLLPIYGHIVVRRGGHSLQIQVVPAWSPERPSTLIHSIQVEADTDQQSALLAEVGSFLASTAVWE